VAAQASEIEMFFDLEIFCCEEPSRRFQPTINCALQRFATLVMAGHQARSAVFAYNVPAMTDQQSPKNFLRADRAPHQRR
jgi:hypothetical protein